MKNILDMTEADYRLESVQKFDVAGFSKIKTDTERYKMLKKLFLEQSMDSEVTGDDWGQFAYNIIEFCMPVLRKEMRKEAYDMMLELYRKESDLPYRDTREQKTGPEVRVPLHRTELH